MPSHDHDHDDEDVEAEEEQAHDFDDDDRQARIWNLLLLINPGDEDAALRQFDHWRERVAEAGGEWDEDQLWLRALAEAIDWRAGFRIEADDIDALVTALDELAARWNLRIDWGGDLDDEDFLTTIDVPALLAVAYDRLREHGYSLWSWNSEDGTRAGWIALSRDDEAMLALTSLLGVEVRPGSDPF